MNPVIATLITSLTLAAATGQPVRGDLQIGEKHFCVKYDNTKEYSIFEGKCKVKKHDSNVPVNNND